MDPTFAVNRDRLLDTALRLVAAPSRTGEGGAVAHCLADILRVDGFSVERPEAGHPAAPAVVVRFNSGEPGRILQFDGHLDVVHLPFVQPAEEGGRLTGSGACDMKGGVAAAIEALRALRDANALTAGGVLFTAHDLHEAPWGLGQQLDRLIADGVVGDGVVIPEPLCDRLPVVGRGALTWKATLRRPGPPVHEVMRPHEPNVIVAGAELIARLHRLDARLAESADPTAGRESVFVGQIHSGEIYNQYPQECVIEGTRRWLPGAARGDVEDEFRGVLSEVERATGAMATAKVRFIRDAFRLNQADPLVAAFQHAHATESGKPLSIGPKPFVDDGNSFWGLRQLPAITHGPRAGGQHTVLEWVEIDDLARVARLYVRTALAYCAGKV